MLNIEHKSTKELDVPSASNIRGMPRCFSAMSKARFRFSRGLSCKVAKELARVTKQWYRRYLRELRVVNQVRSVSVDECTEGETVLPAEVEVLHIHIPVGGRLTLTPQQETLLGGHFWLGKGEKV